MLKKNTEMNQQSEEKELENLKKENILLKNQLNQLMAENSSMLLQQDSVYRATLINTIRENTAAIKELAVIAREASSPTSTEEDNFEKITEGKKRYEDDEDFEDDEEEQEDEEDEPIEFESKPKKFFNKNKKGRPLKKRYEEDEE